ncbi:MAG: sigma 54-interacting transcriptional regulator [Deltaproteobacteria bacterium]|nr:sigma 54-interacting transcriptional regulator [Deltaproteobacteria bacterium]
MRFTALLHHIYNCEALRAAYLSLKREAAPGVDGETWRHYGEALEANLQDLSERLKRGAYRAKPVRRVFIPKADGRQRPLQRIPIIDDGKVVGVFGQATFIDVSDLGRLAKEIAALQSKVAHYRNELSVLREARYSLESIRGSSRATVALKQEARKAATTDLPVLITGESGTGKELFAQAIHQASRRSRAPCIRVNCAALPKELFEAELFGYASGAFTGARKGGKAGKFEAAQGGTIFLDEVGELPLELQPKLLRVLEEREFERVGDNTVVKADFRLVAATNRNLEEMIKTRRFREDLYYRLNVIRLHIPPLRERPEDIVPLARHFLSKIAERTGVPAYELSPQAERALPAYPWPGNIRELLNVLERTAYVLEGTRIDGADLPLFLTTGTRRQNKDDRQTLRDIVAQAEHDALQRALEITDKNKAKAAELLGIHRTIFFRKIKKYGLI